MLHCLNVYLTLLFSRVSVLTLNSSKTKFILSQRILRPSQQASSSPPTASPHSPDHTPTPHVPHTHPLRPAHTSPTPASQPGNPPNTSRPSPPTPSRQPP